MRLLLGFDPGGRQRFGWSVVEDATQPPLNVVNGGVSDHAEAAVKDVLKTVKGADRDRCVLAAGIDAPLFWCPRGDRHVDQMVRESIRSQNAPGSTVQTVNSLCGACVAQGVMVASKLRELWPDLRLTEAHPKALLWTTGVAASGNPPGQITLGSLAALFRTPLTLPGVDHVRDAAIAAYCAWAMIHQLDGWTDLLLSEEAPYRPVHGPLSYWYPIPA